MNCINNTINLITNNIRNWLTFEQFRITTMQMNSETKQIECLWNSENDNYYVNKI